MTAATEDCTNVDMYLKYAEEHMAALEAGKERCTVKWEDFQSGIVLKNNPCRTTACLLDLACEVKENQTRIIAKELKKEHEYVKVCFNVGGR